MLNKHICIEPYFCSKRYTEKVIATIYLTSVPAILKIADFFFFYICDFIFHRVTILWLLVFVIVSQFS